MNKQRQCYHHGVLTLSFCHYGVPGHLFRNCPQQLSRVSNTDADSNTPVYLDNDCDGIGMEHPDPAMDKLHYWESTRE